MAATLVNAHFLKLSQMFNILILWSRKCLIFTIVADMQRADDDKMSFQLARDCYARMQLCWIKTLAIQRGSDKLNTKNVSIDVESPKSHVSPRYRLEMIYSENQWKCHADESRRPLDTFIDHVEH
jgi:hypothetical protein